MIEVVAVAGLATVQDRGRPGRMREGIPPGGALVPELLARANANARNKADEAAVELFGSMTLAPHACVFVATDESPGSWLRQGERLIVSSGRDRVRYVAVRGGVDVAVVLGGKGTLAVAGFGGYEGRPLRKGDALPVGGSAEAHTEPPLRPDPAAAIRVVPGPDGDRFAPSALGTLLASPFAVSARSDRVGVRLSGPALERRGCDTAISAPMTRGAIQVPASGELIVLGPDHPTTGGYPVVATVTLRDWGILMARPIGAEVRFGL